MKPTLLFILQAAFTTLIFYYLGNFSIAAAILASIVLLTVITITKPWYVKLITKIVKRLVP